MLIEQNFFHRNDYQCLFAKDPRTGYWMGFIGIRPENKLFGSLFLLTKNDVAFYHYNINNQLRTEAETRKILWYMGFLSESYSKEKSLQIFISAIDNFPKI